MTVYEKECLDVLSELWELTEDVDEQNAANWSHQLAEKHNQVLIDVWGVLCTMQDEIQNHRNERDAERKGRGMNEPRLLMIQDALNTGLAHARESLVRHDATLGRGTVRNLRKALQIESDILDLQLAIGMLDEICERDAG